MMPPTESSLPRPQGSLTKVFAVVGEIHPPTRKARQQPCCRMFAPTKATLRSKAGLQPHCARSGDESENDRIQYPLIFESGHPSQKSQCYGKRMTYHG
jgi:hypothetical protein